jgi:hypothetical protein
MTARTERFNTAYQSFVVGKTTRDDAQGIDVRVSPTVRSRPAELARKFLRRSGDVKIFARIIALAGLLFGCYNMYWGVQSGMLFFSSDKILLELMHTRATLLFLGGFAVVQLGFLTFLVAGRKVR